MTTPRPLPSLAALATLALLSAGCGGDVAQIGARQDMSGSNNTTSADMSAPADMSASADMSAPADMGDASDLPPRAVSLLGGRCAGAEDLSFTEADARTPGTYEVGDFRVTVDAAGRLDVRHVHAPDRSLLSTPADEAPLRVAKVALDVTDTQGSFSLAEEVEAQCRKWSFDKLLHRGDQLIVQGSFYDGEDLCEGLRVELQLCPAEAKDHLGFSVELSKPEVFNRIELFVASSRDERVYGMGEQFPHNTLNLKGRAIPVIAQEGGIGRGHTPISQSVNAASPGSAGSEGSTYYAAPHYLTNTRRSLFLEDTEYAVFDFTEDQRTTLRLYSNRMRGRVLYGEDPLTLIERFTEYAGRMPPLPDWVHTGAIVALARPLDESAAIIAQLQAAEVQIAAVWNQTWSGLSETFIGEQVLWNWIQNPNTHPGWDGFVQRMNAQGVRVMCYINPMLRPLPGDAGPLRRDLFSEGDAAGYFVKNEEGRTLMIPVTAFDVGLLDLTNEEARGWMKGLIKEELMGRAGCAGWMADFAEALPFEAHLSDGTPAAAYHNQYPVAWAQLNREAVEEAGRLGDVLVFNRSGHTRTPAYSMLLWQGDQLTTWDKYDGLVSALHGLISGGLSGIAYNHSDIGGYTSLSRFGLGYSREADQLKRWAELSAFTAVMRTHEGNQPDANAQIYSDAEAMDHFARMSKVYRALGFYRRQLQQEASDHGWPLVRHLMLHYPDDPRAWEVDDQFMLGAELLVAPIKNKCFTPPICPYNKEVYLPPGRWVHLWSGKAYGREAGDTITIAAPMGEPAVFIKADSPIIPNLKQRLNAMGIQAL